MPENLTTCAAAPQLLLITGAPASGKTRLMRALDARYQANCCSKDEFKEILFDQLGQADAAWSQRLSSASFALLFAVAPRLLSAGALLILEGNFRAGEHDLPLRSLLQRGAARAAQVLCVAQPSTRASRLAQRAADPARHRGHRDEQTVIATSAVAAFLDLAGPRWSFDSDADWASEFSALCQRLEGWLALVASVAQRSSTSSTSV